jgi:hypothetical protein
LSLAKVCSMGLRSGESAGRNKNQAPHCFRQASALALLWDREVVEDHHVTLRQCWSNLETSRNLAFRPGS